SAGFRPAGRAYRGSRVEQLRLPAGSGTDGSLCGPRSHKDSRGITAPEYKENIKIEPPGHLCGLGPTPDLLSGRALLCRQLQAVADTKLVQDVRRPGRVRFELVAQAADKAPKILHLIGLRRAPDLAQQMAMGQHLASMHDEMT